MTEQEIQAFEKELKAMPLRPLSAAFFAAVEKEMVAGDAQESTTSPGDDVLPEDLAEVESALKRLRPRAPSAEFFKRVEAELAEDDAKNTLNFTQEKQKKSSGWAIAFRRWASTAAAVGVLAFGLYQWKAPDDLEKRFEDYGYQLVSTESELCNVEELPLEVQEDGSIVQPLRYIYTNTKHWRDPDSEKTFTECVPFEKIVSTAVAVY